MTAKAKHLIVLVAFLLNLQLSHQFASMLVERQSSCWIFVRDASEVVMNNFITPVDQSSHPNVSIELYDEDNNSLVEAIEEGSGRKVVYIEDQRETSDFGHDQKLTKKYIAKLKLDDDLKDLQYVMDLKVTPELDDDELKKLTGEEARMQAKFTSSSKGCSDYRAFGRGRDGGLHFEIAVPSSVYDLKDFSDHTVDLVAVWACGHEAITLTQPIVFLPRIGGATAASVNSDVNIEAASPNDNTNDKIPNDERTNENEEPAITKQETPLAKGNPPIDVPEEQALLAEDTPNDIDVLDSHQAREKVDERLHHREHDNKSGNAATDQAFDGPEPINPSSDIIVNKNEEDRDKSNLRTHRNQQKHYAKKKRDKHQEIPHQRIRKFNLKYNAKEFGQPVFTTNTYLCGLAVLVCAGGSVLRLFLFFSNGRKLDSSKEV